MNILDAFKKFAKKYGDEIAVVAEILGTTIDNLPIDKQDRENLKAKIAPLLVIGKKLAGALKTIEEAKPLAVKRDELEAALRKLLPELVNAAVREALEGKGATPPPPKAQTKPAKSAK